MCGEICALYQERNRFLAGAPITSWPSMIMGFAIRITVDLIQVVIACRRRTVHCSSLALSCRYKHTAALFDTRAVRALACQLGANGLDAVWSACSRRTWHSGFLLSGSCSVACRSFRFKRGERVYMVSNLRPVTPASAAIEAQDCPRNVTSFSARRTVIPRLEVDSRVSNDHIHAKTSLLPSTAF